MRQLPFRRGVALTLALAVLAALGLALWLGVFREERAAASPGVDLVITKTASPTEATPVVTGGVITYTLDVDNIGDAAASDVVIRDYIGAGLEFVSATPGSGVTCGDITPPEINCTAANISAGGSATVTIVLKVTAASGSFVYNGAYVDPDDAITPEDNDDADDPDHDCTAVGEGTDTGVTEPDNYDCTEHEVGTADLTITKTASPAQGASVTPGSTIVYTLAATNAALATGTATNVAIRDWVGDGLTFVSATPQSGVTCGDTTPPEINCTVASLAPNETKTVAITVSVTGTASVVLNGARVDPDNVITEANEDADDPDLLCGTVGEGSDTGATEPDNYDCTSHGVTGLPELSIIKTASPSDTSTVANGSTITYTLSVSNASGAAGTANNVPIRDYIGTGLTFVSATPGAGVSCADIDPPEINCTATSIAPAETRTVTIVVTVSATSGTVLNGARVDPANAITEVNEDADDPSLDCSGVGEGTDAGDATEPDNYDCTSHTVGAATATPTPTPTGTPTVGQLLNCPFVGKWAMSVWDGPTGTATDSALATCTGVTIGAAYALDRTTNQWTHYFPGAAADVNNLLTLSEMQAIFTLGQ